MVRSNKTKAKLNEGQVAIGASINFYAPGLVELYGVMGFDWVWIDCEHGSSNDSETENMVRAAELYDLTPIVRIPNTYPSTILRFLDRGAQGIIVPHISNRAEAEGVAQASGITRWATAAAPPGAELIFSEPDCPRRSITPQPIGKPRLS